MYEKCYWITGTPRTGSMWTTNIVRGIFDLSGFNVLPKEFQTDEAKWEDIFLRNVINNESDQDRFVLKGHNKLKTSLPKTKFIVNKRNPYEICASYFEFMKSDLQTAVNVAKALKEAISHYGAVGPEKCLFIEYNDIIDRPGDVIQQLSEYCQVKLSFAQQQELTQRFSKENVKRQIDEGRRAVTAGSNDFTIFRTKNHIRSFDKKTGFQSGHVSNRKSGQWRSAFSSSQSHIVINALDATATSLGYPSEKRNLERLLVG
jgi:hypothetical protein